VLLVVFWTWVNLLFHSLLWNVMDVKYELIMYLGDAFNHKIYMT
jgi:hypothetical protein